MKQKRVLVTGGAGYIGSACVKALCDAGYIVTVLDNLSTGARKYVDTRSDFMKLDLLDRAAVAKFFNSRKFDIVIHLAAHKDSYESTKNAAKYSENIAMTINLLDFMAKHKIPKIIFSSSAAVYGPIKKVPIAENNPTQPANYYGQTKLICEELIQWYSKIYGIKYIIFRYFNVAGDIGLKYKEKQAGNLFPVIRRVIAGEQKDLKIFGNDYNTPDGTCVRDYIHIHDIVRAHMRAFSPCRSGVFNLGTGRGHSVLEVINAFEKRLPKPLRKKISPRRAGDTGCIYADPIKARVTLKWFALKNLDDMVRTII
jgi:UDP-glucose 4-epimerase